MHDDGPELTRARERHVARLKKRRGKKPPPDAPHLPRNQRRTSGAYSAKPGLGARGWFV